MSGEGDSHRVTSRASENAAKILWGATAKRRRTSAYASFIACFLPQKAIKLRDGSRPERLMARDPSARVLQRFSPQPKPVDASIDAAFDQSGLLQHLEVFRDC